MYTWDFQKSRGILFCIKQCIKQKDGACMYIILTYFMFGVNYVGIHFKALKHGINTSMISVMIKFIKTFSMNR